MAGGEPGSIGANYWMKKTKRKSDDEAERWTKINLGGCNQTRMLKGDHIVVRKYRSQVGSSRKDATRNGLE
jgi:N-methylhydantoinase B/oxoprolinase/acetone carboxylase alpha subunit